MARLLVFTNEAGQVTGAVVGDPIRVGDTTIQARPSSRTTPTAVQSQKVNRVEVDDELLQSSPEDLLAHLQNVVSKG